MKDGEPPRENSRGKRKLSKDSLVAFPREIIGTFARLPRVFRKFDVDRLLGNKISRSMKWRYLNRMENLGLIRHTTKKYYQKIYSSISDWLEKVVVPRVKQTEMRNNSDREKE
ncbi:MAG: hypothetical protein V1857_04530 [archaeon]